MPSGSGLEAIIAGHQTPALKDASADGLTTAVAISRYLTFAGQQLAGAEADISAGSVALFGLGKIYMVPESAHGPGDTTHGGKAVAVEQAALLVDSRNARAANEMGVLLVRFGRLEEAKAVFLRSLAAAPQPNTWKNLAVVHHNLGENDLADKAWHESLLMAAQMRASGATASTSGYAVQWVDPATFARSSPLPIDGTPPDKQAVRHGASPARRPGRRRNDSDEQSERAITFSPVPRTTYETDHEHRAAVASSRCEFGPAGNFRRSRSPLALVRRIDSPPLVDDGRGRDRRSRRVGLCRHTFPLALRPPSSQQQ